MSMMGAVLRAPGGAGTLGTQSPLPLAVPVPPPAVCLAAKCLGSEEAGLAVGMGAGSTAWHTGPGSGRGCQEQLCNQYHCSASSHMPPV